MTLGDQTAIVTLAVRDLDTARKFYDDVLGLRRAPEQEEGTLAYATGSSTIFVYPSQYAGTNRATAVTWIVDDVEGLVQALRDRGVAFEHYTDLPDTELVGDVHVSGDRRLAWFQDPDGNIHGLAGR